MTNFQKFQLHNTNNVLTYFISALNYIPLYMVICKFQTLQTVNICRIRYISELEISFWGDMYGSVYVGVLHLRLGAAAVFVCHVVKISFALMFSIMYTLFAD